MTTGITIGRRRVRSSMNLPSERRACRRSVSRSSAPSAIAPSIAARHGLLRVFDEILRFGRVDPTAGDDLGAGHDLARLGVDGDDHDDDAFFGEHAAVAQHAVADVADDPVDVHVAGGHGVAFAVRAFGSERDHVAVFADEHPIFGNADVAGQLRVMHEVAVLAVHGHEPLGFEQAEQELQLLLRRVPRNVHRRRAIVHDFGAGAMQRVDHARHVRLVARDRVRADHDDVVGGDLHVLVLVRGHQRQRAHRLTLRAGTHDAHFFGRELGRLVDVDHGADRGCRRSRARAPS